MSNAATILDALVQSLQAATTYNTSVAVPPAAVLWTDEARQWQPLIPLVRELVPAFATLGDYEPATMTGPAVWLRALLVRAMEGEQWPEDAVPVVYLPGVSRQMLRAMESCPRELQPLAELQYRGVLWSQPNGRDWTVLAFLKSKAGLNLDVAQSAGAVEAMQRALPELARTPVDALENRRLEAADFNKLLTSDPVRDLLTWLDAPEKTAATWGPQRWAAFRSICKSSFDFDPKTDGDLVGAERLGGRQGEWQKVWDRFADAPKNYPNLPDLLDRAEPTTQTMFADRSSWPRANATAEDDLRTALVGLEGRSSSEARGRLHELEERHGPRRGWVWADLDRAPLAKALGHLAVLAEVTSSDLGGTSTDEMGRAYLEGGWRADAAVLAALGCVRKTKDVDAVRTAIQVVYQPWLEKAAVRLQKLVGEAGFPGYAPGEKAAVKADKGECIFFADGLRLDVGHWLRERLEARGLRVQMRTRWMGLPSVTPTCKYAVSPIADKLTGKDFNEDFTPAIAETDELLSHYRFQKLLADNGYQVLGHDDPGDPKGRAWAEHGDLDKVGHEKGFKLAWRLDEQVAEIAERIEAMLAVGWKRVTVVTDHGWLLVPGGMPKVQLPMYLASTRWGRAAVLKTTATSKGHLVVDWRWAPSVRVALPPGISSYKGGARYEYSHGGLSLQECLTPVLQVERSAAAGGAHVVIDEATWRGLRCRVDVSDAPAGSEVDLRIKPNDASTSVLSGTKPVDDGRASLLVEDDDQLGSSACVVVLDSTGKPIAKRTTVVGGE